MTEQQAFDRVLGELEHIEKQLTLREQLSFLGDLEVEIQSRIDLVKATRAMLAGANP